METTSIRSGTDTYDRSIGMTMTLPFDRRSNNTIQSSRINTKLGRQMFLNTCLSLLNRSPITTTSVSIIVKSGINCKTAETSRRIDEASKLNSNMAQYPYDLQQNHQNYLDSINNLAKQKTPMQQRR